MLPSRLPLYIVADRGLALIGGQVRLRRLLKIDLLPLQAESSRRPGLSGQLNILLNRPSAALLRPSSRAC
jgi:hypothetical protein